MGLVFLVLCGGVLGWLAAIMTNADDRAGIAVNILLGIAGALIAGWVGPLWLGSGSLLEGTYSVDAMLAALFGAVALLLAANVLKRQVR